MLGTAQDLKSALLALEPTKDKTQGITKFVGVISSFMNKVQGGPLGSPGIFTFNDAAMIAILMTQQPVKDNSWIPTFASAWEAGCIAAVIAPGTVTNPVWIGSGTKDVATLPTAAATITTLSAAKALLTAGLASVGPTSDAPLPLANAIRNATLAFVFNCIGLGPPPPLTPIPVPTPAE